MKCKKIISIIFVFGFILEIWLGGVEQIKANSYQAAMWFMDDLNITQVPGGGYSHLGTENFDVVGVNNKNVKAPFDCEIVAIFTGYDAGNTVIIQSVAPVQYANGYVDYMSMSFAHDNNISDCYIGKRINQGEIFYQNGNYGNVTGVHTHALCIQGKYTDHPGWIKVSSGNYTFSHGLNPQDCLYLKPTTRVYDNKLMSFRTYLSDTQAPSFSSTKYVGSNRGFYVVQAVVSDNVGVTKVEFPAWTPAGGQDDLIWHQGTKINDNTWQCTINMSEHNMEAGSYITHVYAYDAAGNKSSVDAGIITIHDYSKNDLVNMGDDFYAYICTNVGTKLAVSDTKTAINNTYYDLIHAKYDATKDSRFLWHFIRDASTGTYMIKNDETSTKFDVAYFSLDSGANIILTGTVQGTTKGSTNQQWKISKNELGYQLSTVCTSYTAMDIQNANSGSSVYMYYYSPSNTNQVFNIEKKIDDSEAPVISDNSFTSNGEKVLKFNAVLTDNYGLNMIKDYRCYLYYSTDENSGRILTTRGIRNTNWGNYSSANLNPTSINKKIYNLECDYEIIIDGLPAIEVTVSDLAGNETSALTKYPSAVMANGDRLRFELEQGESISLSSIFESVINKYSSTNYIIRCDFNNMRILKKSNVDNSEDLFTDSASVNKLTTIFTGNEAGVEHIYFTNIKTGAMVSCRIQVNEKKKKQHRIRHRHLYQQLHQQLHQRRHQCK